MKKVILGILLVIGLGSCGFDSYKGYESYDDYVIHDINTLKSPVILIGKSCSMSMWGITVKDGKDSIRHYGNASSLANNIGESRNIGDTIK